MSTHSKSASSERAWAIGIGLFAVAQLVVGPIITYFQPIEVLLAITSILLVAASAWRLRAGLPSRYATWSVALLGLGLLWMGLQLIPLPVELWTSLPARQVVVDTLEAAKLTPGAMPLSLDPFLTRSSILYILPGIGLFFASLSVQPQYRRDLALVIVAAAVVCAMLGLIQKFQGAGSDFYLFPNPALDTSAKGTFQNRNFFAAQLYTTIPFVAALAVATLVGRNINRFVVTFMLAIYFVTLMAALGASGSRGGLMLAMLAVLLSCVLAWNGRNVTAGAISSARFILPTMIAAMLLIAQFGLVALLRVAQTDTANDIRGKIAATTLEAIRAHFPAGSGFGTFVPVYKFFERPEDLQPKFINAAHNDWLQLLLEGGLPMAAILTGFVIWYLITSINIWRTGKNTIEDLLSRAATIVILVLLIHSIFDYPLRTRAMMAAFALCCGLMSFGIHRKPSSVRSRNPMPDHLKEPVQSPPRTAPYFVQKDK